MAASSGSSEKTEMFETYLSVALTIDHSKDRAWGRKESLTNSFPTQPFCPREPENFIIRPKRWVLERLESYRFRGRLLAVP
jgi:hypothetical protein